MNIMISMDIRTHSGLFLFLTLCHAFDFDNCRLPLGVTSGNIADDQMTASSSYDANNTGPQNARVNVERAGGAWCPRPQISAGTYEFLEVRLARSHVVTAVLTQGRYGRGRGMEFTETFRLQYWRTEVGWRNYTRWNGRSLLGGNSDVVSVKENSLEPLVVAERVRFVPYSNHPRTVCLRVELLGCPFTDDIVSYSAPEGDIYSINGEEISLRDESYDGQQRELFMSRGLGQLTDGVSGSDDLTSDLGQGKGYVWVGWRSNDSTSRRYPVELTFEFSTPKNLTSLEIVSSVDHSQQFQGWKHAAVCPHASSTSVRIRGLGDSTQAGFDRQTFALARVFYSMDGKLYDPQPVLYYSPLHFTHRRQARRTRVNLQRRAAKFLKLHLFHRSQWLAISEIAFESEVCDQLCVMSTLISGVPVPHQDVWMARPYDIKKIADVRHSEDLERSTTSATNAAAITGGLLLVLAALLVASLVAASWWRRRRHKFGQLTYSTIVGALGERKMTISMRDVSQRISLRPLHRSLSHPKTPVICASASSPRHISQPPPAASPLACQRAAVNESRMIIDRGANSLLSTKPSLSERDVKSSTVSAILCGSRRRLATEFNSESSLELSDSASYENSQPMMAPCSWPSGGATRTMAPPLAARPPLDSATMTTICGSGGGGAVSSATTDSSYSSGVSGGVNARGHRRQRNRRSSQESVGDWLERVIGGDVEVIHSSSLHIQQRLGVGKYGEVLVCTSDQPAMGVLVAKCIPRRLSDELRRQLSEDLRTAVGLRHRHICRVVGIMHQPPALLLQHSAEGDLNQLLQNRVTDPGGGGVIDSTGAVVSCSQQSQPLVTGSARVITFEELLHIAVQISEGMSYMEQRGIAHKDLATRNCMIFNDGRLVRLTDTASANDLYASDYCCLAERVRVPLRWLSWEILYTGEYSLKSDVWSFGVTLWEIFSLARETPYEPLTDTEVLANIELMAHNTRPLPPSYLQCPIGCPSSIYRMILQCWCRLPEDRPTFSQVTTFLRQRHRVADRLASSSDSESTSDLMSSRSSQKSPGGEEPTLRAQRHKIRLDDIT